ncbi:MAG TPA: 5-oxoprolinase subunit PxpA [Verrucomicrobiae bacterium]|nr:5-oxoprolinase subunit PxpA [Verrucomicrobiae bacterium]
MRLDLNCDLGEGESRRQTRALMRWITSANVACGGHAGDVSTMRACVRWAREFRVNLGAHPGVPTVDGFGRGALQLAAGQLELLLLQQVGVLARIAGEEKVPLHHIKLHGSLYHAVEGSQPLAREYLRLSAHWWPGCVVFAFAGGRVARWARRMGVPVWEEAFVDRAYRDDGTLLPRGAPGALLTDRHAILERVRRLQAGQAIESERGRPLRLRARTMCLHGDTPGASQLASAIARVAGRSAIKATPAG